MPNSLFSLNQPIWVTLFCHSSLLEEVFRPDERDLGKGIEHGEDHPDVDHLDVGGCWEGLRDPNKTERNYLAIFCNIEM